MDFKSGHHRNPIGETRWLWNSQKFYINSIAFCCSDRRLIPMKVPSVPSISLWYFTTFPMEFSQRSSRQQNSSRIPVGIMTRILLRLIFTTILNEIKDIPSISRGNKQGQYDSSPHGLRSRS